MTKKSKKTISIKEIVNHSLGHPTEFNDELGEWGFL